MSDIRVGSESRRLDDVTSGTETSESRTSPSGSHESRSPSECRAPQAESTSSADVRLAEGPALDLSATRGTEQLVKSVSRPSYAGILAGTAQSGAPATAVLVSSSDSRQSADPLGEATCLVACSAAMGKLLPGATGGIIGSLVCSSLCDAGPYQAPAQLDPGNGTEGTGATQAGRASSAGGSSGI
jgi:hypothetical protein